MKKIIITLLLGLASPVIAMDDAAEQDLVSREIEQTLTDEEFYELIGDPTKIENDLLEQETTYHILLGLVQAHERYKNFNPNIEEIAQHHDLSRFSKLGYNPETKRFSSLSQEQEENYMFLCKKTATANSYRYANQLLDDTLVAIKAEEAAHNENNSCTIL